MASNWPTTTLAKVAKLRSGFPFKSASWTPNGVPVIKISNVKGGRVLLDGCGFVSKSTAASASEWYSRDGDVLIAMTGYVGEVALVRPGEKYLINQRVGRFEFLEDSPVEPSFLFYFLQSPDVRYQIEDMARGSAQPNLSAGDASKLEIPVPPRDAQLTIASIGRALDDRIDLLRQTNATLEAIAQALFKSWFVDFDPVRANAEGREPVGMDAATAALFPSEFEAPELGLIPRGWHRGPLGDLCRNIRQQAKPDSLDPTTPYIGLEHMPRGSIALTEAGSASGLASGKFWYAKNDVLFGKLRPYFHKVGVASHTGVCSTDILVVRANEPDWFGFTAMQLSSDGIIAYATRLSNGAKMPRSSWSDIAAYKVVIPPETVARSFDGLVRAIIERIHANIDRATNLACLRDTLLPRLISGKLRLSEAERSIEDAAA